MCLAVPGKIVAVEKKTRGLRTGVVDFEGISKRVCLAYVPEAGMGDYVLVHVGFALTRIDEAEAEQVFEDLRRLRAEEES